MIYAYHDIAYIKYDTSYITIKSEKFRNLLFYNITRYKSEYNHLGPN